MSGKLVIYEQDATLTVKNTTSNELWARGKEENGPWSHWMRIRPGRSVCGNQQKWRQSGNTYTALVKNNDCPHGYNAIIDKGVNFQQFQFATANPSTNSAAKKSSIVTLNIQKPRPTITFNNREIVVSKKTPFKFYGCSGG